MLLMMMMVSMMIGGTTLLMMMVSIRLLLCCQGNDFCNGCFLLSGHRDLMLQLLDGMCIRRDLTTASSTATTASST